MEPSPPDHLSGNHPEPVVHPRMNSRSEQRALHCVRTPLTFHTSCHASVCYDCLYLLCFVPLYLSVDPAAAADYTAAEYDYVVDDRTPTVELPGKQSHSPLPHIVYLSIFICCTRHMLLLRYNPIQLHSLSLSPLDYLSDILCSL